MIAHYINHPITKLIGFRGSVLLLFGITWLLSGYFQLTAPAPQLKAEPTALSYLLPIQYYGLVWIAGGLLGVTFAFVNTRRHPGRDTLGFVGIEIPVLAWALNFFFSGLLLDYPRGLLAAITWGFIAILLMRLAAWPEPPLVSTE